MKQIGNKDSQEFEQRVKDAIASNSIIKDVLDFLPDSEYNLILFMVKNNAWQGDVPPPPDQYDAKGGSIEFGLFLYWFNNPELLKLEGFTPFEKFIVDVILRYLASSGYLPATKFNQANYDFFSTNELIYVDGTVLSMEAYATFDQGWFTAFLNLFVTLIDRLWYNNRTFPTTTPAQITLHGAVANKVSIAILGDWGAGNAASQEVMHNIVALKPDYIIHVGDVYYGGTPSEDKHYANRYLAPGEERQNLLDLWPSNYAGKSFTLNSNHEMYSGANGLFYDALGVGGKSTPFSAQQGASCFALEFAGWTLLGLDSAFNGSVIKAFMAGSIGEASGFQSQWIQGLNLNPNKTIVLSHHNGISDDGESYTKVWDEINAALKGDPYAWYWGHVHNGIVYKQPVTVPVGTGVAKQTYARCLGHAALPYGKASSLVGQPIAWQANSPKPLPSKELYNGFAMLKLTSDHNNQLIDITECYYDVSPIAAQPVYTKRLL